MNPAGPLARVSLSSRVFGVCFIALCLSGCAATGGSAPSIADADRDGVSDATDECADTGYPQPVYESGCAVFAGTLAGVNFAANSADLGREARIGLDQLVSLLNLHPSVVIAVDAHTDNRGSGIRNLELSKQRVMAVVRYLVARGIRPERLRPYGYGEARPLVSNASPEGRKRNRRIEVSVVLGAGSAATGSVATTR